MTERDSSSPPVLPLGFKGLGDRDITTTRGSIALSLLLSLLGMSGSGRAAMVMVVVSAWKRRRYEEIIVVLRRSGILVITH